MRGRCLSYGEGITYWPVVEVVKQLDALPSDERLPSAIRSLLGESDAAAGADEIAWAFRKLLEEQAPLVVCFDDIQWGEETFLDLVESTALLSTGAPLLLALHGAAGAARPPSGLAGRRCGSSRCRRTRPTSWSATPSPDEVRERIVARLGRQPALHHGDARDGERAGDVEVPPTLKALLAARLDQLDEPERRVLERGSVEGELFHRGAVQALAPEETEVTPRLAALVRRELVRPDRPQLPGEDAYRFRHLLIRDAAYDALPKATRADLHERFADWLEEHGQSLVELDEIVGYHLEQAARYLAELGRPDPELAEDASRRLTAAGERSRWHGDRRAAQSLFGRAVKLLAEPEVHLAVAFAMSHAAARDAEPLLEEAARRADAHDDQAGAAFARALAAQTRVWTGEGSSEEAEEVALAALPLLEKRQDHSALADVWFSLGNGAYNHRCRYDELADAAEKARGTRRWWAGRTIAPTGCTRWVSGSGRVRWRTSCGAWTSSTPPPGSMRFARECSRLAAGSKRRGRLPPLPRSALASWAPLYTPRIPRSTRFPAITRPPRRGSGPGATRRWSRASRQEPGCSQALRGAGALPDRPVRGGGASAGQVRRARRLRQSHEPGALAAGRRPACC